MKYTIPLRKKVECAPRYKRAKRAVGAVRTYLQKHLKGEDVRLGQNLNKALWSRGVKNPLNKITVDAEKGKDGVIRAEISGTTYNEPTLEERESGKEQDLKAAAEKAMAAQKKDEKASEKKEEKKSESKPDEKKEAPKKESSDKKAAPKKETKKAEEKESKKE